MKKSEKIVDWQAELRRTYNKLEAAMEIDDAESVVDLERMLENLNKKLQEGAM